MGQLRQTDLFGSKAIGYAQYAPSKYFPNLENYPVRPLKDAVYIGCLYMREGYRRRNYGSMLLNSILEELKGRGEYAVETIAKRSDSNNPSGHLGFYIKNKFYIIKDHPEYPLVRKDLM